MFKKAICLLVVFALVFTQIPSTLAYADDPDTEPPSTPTNLSVSAKDCVSITIGWDASSDNVGVTGYDIYLAETLVDTVSALTYTSTNLTPNTSYTFNVKAKDAAGNASIGATITEATNQDTQPPTIPTGLSSSDITETSASISWEASSDNIGVIRYNVYRDNVLVGNSATTNYTDTNLSSGTSYSYTVTAKDAAENESQASDALSVQTIDTQAPTIPANLVSTAKSTTSITLSWDASTDNVGVTGYIIYNNTSEIGTTSGETTTTLTDLSPGTSYTLTVKAHDAANNISDASNTIIITTIPGIPTNLTYTATYDSITVSWAPVPGATSYEIYDGISTISVTDTSKRFYYYMGYGSSHTYKVRAKTDSDTGAWSDTLTAWVKLFKPESFSVTPNKLSMKLTWASVPGATSYDIEIDGTTVANVITTSYWHQNLVAGEVHVYRVKAKNNNTDSDWAGPISKTVIDYTPLSGTIGSNRTLTPEEGPYGIIGNLTVASNITLTINAGTLIRVNPGVFIYVGGKIQANGDELHNINITSMKDPLFGGTGINSLSDYWAQIEIRNNGEFNGTYVNVYYNGVYYPTFDYYNYNFYLTGTKSTLVMNHCKTKYSDNCAIDVKNSVTDLTLQVENTTFENIKNAGIKFENNSLGVGSVSVTNNVFTNCGVYVSNRGNTGFIIDNNTFVGNDQTSIIINSFGSGTLSANNNIITNSTNYPIFINLADVPSTIFDCIYSNVLTNNVRNNVQVNEIAIGGTIPSGKTMTIKGNRKYIASASYGAAAGGTLNIEPGAWILAGVRNVNLYVYGIVNINGNISSPVVITTIKDKDYGGSGVVNDDDRWYGIFEEYPGELNATNAAIRYADYDNVYCLHGKLNIKFCEISHAGRLAFNISCNDTPIIKYNTIVDNPTILSSPDTTAIDLTYNYFGSPYGPSNMLVYGSTQAVFYPWLGCESANKFRFGVNGVNSATGNYSTSNTDLSLKVPGFDLKIDRIYNSTDSQDPGLLGKGWKLNYDCMVKDYTSKIMKADGTYDTVTLKTLKTVNLLDGRMITFSLQQNGTYEGNDSRNKLVKEANGTYTLTTTDQFVYRFSENGYLTSAEDRNGNTLSFAYNTSNKLISITDQAGRTISFTYNAQNYINQITGPQNRAISYTYNEDGYLLTVANPMGGVTTYLYDTSGYLSQIKNNKDYSIEAIVYDHTAGANQHKVSQLTDKYGNVKTYSYDNENKKTTITDTNGRSTVQEYDGNYTVNKSTDVDNRAVTIEYFLDSDGRNKLWEVKSVTDRNNNKTEYQIDANGNVTRITNPDASYKQMVYDDKNNCISQRDEEGKFTYFIYDTNKKNLLKKVQPLNGTDTYDGSTEAGFAVTSYAYYTDAETQSLGYGGKKLLKKVTDPEGGQTTYTYDTNGYTASMENAIGKTTTYVYDAAGLMTEETSPSQYSTTYSYDKNGKPVLKVMEGGETYRTAYDAEGNVLKKVQPNLYSAALDNLTTYEYSGNHGTRYTYYDNGSIHTVTDAENNLITYTYDLYGNISTETKPDGAVYRYEYDVLNRLTKTHYKEDASSTEVLLEEVSYSILSGGYTQKTIHKYIDGSIYNIEVNKFDYANRQVDKQNADYTHIITEYYKNGLEKAVTDANGKTTYSRYDGLNRLSEKWIPFEQNGSATAYIYTTYVYDKAGRKTEEKQGKQTVALYGTPSTYATVNYTYYADGNISSVVNSTVSKTEYEYDDSGILSAEKRYSSDTAYVRTVFLNNYWGKPTSKTLYVRKGDLSEFAFSNDDMLGLSTSYTYDANGNLETETNANGHTITYDYDNLDRQKTTSQPGANELGTAVTITTSTLYDYMGNVVSQTDAQGNQTMYIRDGRGFLLKTIDAEYGTTYNTYDLLGRATATVSPLNYLVNQPISAMSRTEYTYDAMNRIKAVSQVYYDTVNSQWVSYVSKACKYDGNGNLIKELDGLGYSAGTGTTPDDIINSGYGKEYTYNYANLTSTVLDPVSKDRSMTFTTKYTYDALGRVSTEINGSGVIKLYAYDDAGNLLTTKVKKDASSIEVTIETKTYDRLGNVLTVTDGNGNTITNTYNALGKAKTTTYPEDTTIAEYTVSSQYDRIGNLTVTFDNNNKKELLTYDAQGRQLSHTERKSDGTQSITTSAKYDKDGNKRFETDGNGNQTEYTYDSLNHVLSTTLEVSGNDHTTSYVYDPNGNLMTTTDWLGNVTTNVYDPLNRLVQRIDATNTTVETLTYSKNDAQSTSTDSLGNVTLFTYDKNNRLLSTRDGGLHVTGKTYDNAGNVATQYDGRNNVTDFAYDEYNRLASVTNASDETTEYAYDTNGNLLTQTDGNGNIKTFEYNVMNLVTRSIDNGGRAGTPGDYVYVPAKTESHTYYKNGALHTTTSRSGVTTTYTYDVHGRLLSKAAGTSSVSYTYDDNGNQLTMTDATGTTTRTYDEQNRVLTKISPVIGTSTFTYDITLNLPSGQVAEQSTDPEANTVQKIYDKAGRLLSVIDGADTTTYAYYSNGARSSVTYDNGAREEYTYSEGMLLTELINRKPDGTVMDTYTYAYDAAHNQTSKTEIVNSVTIGTTSYTYDVQNRLFTVTEPGGMVISYSYDDAGNRYAETVISGTDTRVITYTYNDQNRLTVLGEQLNSETQQTTAYGYDDNGNLLTATRTPYIDGIPQTPVVDATNSYDVWNQMTQTVTEGNTVVNVYNGEGLRTAKSVDGTMTRYLYEYDKVVLETDTDGDETARNVYGLNLLKREIGTDSYYYLYNGHADVTALVDASTGVIAATYYYDAFGNIKNSTGSVSNSICYAGYQYDDETGYYYLNARMYDPLIGRFLQEDSFTGDKNDPLSLNLYTYVKNNPLIYTDPSGHMFVKEDIGKRNNTSSGTKVSSGSRGDGKSSGSLEYDYFNKGAGQFISDVKTEFEKSVSTFMSDPFGIGSTCGKIGAGIGTVCGYVGDFIREPVGSSAEAYGAFIDAGCYVLDKACQIYDDPIGYAINEMSNELKKNDLGRLTLQYIEEMEAYGTPSLSFYENAGGITSKYLFAAGLGVASWGVASAAAPAVAEGVVTAGATDVAVTGSTITAVGTTVGRLSTFALLDQAIGAAGETGVELISVDPNMQPKDIQTGRLNSNGYQHNPTAKNIKSMLKKGTDRLCDDESTLNGQYMYVVDEQGNLIIGTRNKGYWPHPTLVGGENPKVQAAGMVDIRNGKICRVDNSSGHYKPSDAYLAVAEKAFTSLPSSIFSQDFQGFVPYK